MAKRPASTYTVALGEAICALVADGVSLQAISATLGMPPRSTIRSWIECDPAFKAQMDRALVLGLEHHFGEIITIADAVAGSDSPAAVNAARLRIDARKWILSKLAPERFGEQLALTGARGEPLVVDQPSPGRVALAILNMLHDAHRDAEPQPAIVEHEASPEPVKLTLDPAAAPLAIPSRTLLNSAVYDDEQGRRQQQRDAAIARERVRLRLVEFDDGSARNRYEPRSRR
jgi:hypothetical protein